VNDATKKERQTMTDQEIDDFLELYRKDTKTAEAILIRMSPEDRDRVIAKAQEWGRQQVTELFKKAEADGTMDRIRALYAEDLKRKKKEKVTLP
jgi:hypothetical protein